MGLDLDRKGNSQLDSFGLVEVRTFEEKLRLEELGK